MSEGNVFLILLTGFNFLSAAFAASLAGLVFSAAITWSPSSYQRLQHVDPCEYERWCEYVVRGPVIPYGDVILGSFDFTLRRCRSTLDDVTLICL